MTHHQCGDVLPIERSLLDAFGIYTKRIGLLFLIISVNFVIFLLVILWARRPELFVVGLTFGVLVFVIGAKVVNRPMTSSAWAMSLFGALLQPATLRTAIALRNQQIRNRRREPILAAVVHTPSSDLWWVVRRLDGRLVPDHNILMTFIGNHRYILQLSFPPDDCAVIERWFDVEVRFAGLTRTFRCSIPEGGKWLAVCVLDKRHNQFGGISVLSDG